MAKPPKKTTIIPLAPLNYDGTLSKDEQNCLAWHVLSGCTELEAFVKFLHPELASSAAVATKLTRQLFGSKEALNFIERYTKLLEYISKPKTQVIAETSGAIINPKSESKSRLSGESDEDYKKRRKREAAESIVEKIIDRVDEVEDLDGLLDTIKAMKDTKFFEDESTTYAVPVRYLPETCSNCEYKQFIDEQVKLGNITLVKK